MDRRVLLTAGLAALLLASAIGCSRQGSSSGFTDVEWRAYAGDRGSTKYAPLDQINKDNVAQLQIAWRRPAVDSSFVQKKPDVYVPRDFRATPLMINGTLFSPNGIGLVEAFQPATGRTIWVQQPFADEREQGLAGDSTRSVAYWTDGSEGRIFVIRGEYLIALDPNTGQPITSWGDSGRLSLKAGLGPLAAIYDSSARTAGVRRRRHDGRKHD